MHIPRNPRSPDARWPAGPGTTHPGPAGHPSREGSFSYPLLGGVPLSGGVGSFLHHTSKEGKRSLQTLAARPVMRYARGMAETIFLKIIVGEIPCHKIYEDDQVFAFLDIARRPWAECSPG